MTPLTALPVLPAFPQEDRSMTYPPAAARGTAAVHGPVDTGQLWQWVDRLTRDRKHRLVRQAPRMKPTVEYVPVPSLWTQLLEALASSNAGGGRGKSSTGSRSPLDLGKLALMSDIDRTTVRAMNHYGHPIRVVAHNDDGTAVRDIPAELRQLAALAVTMCDPAGVDWWVGRYRSWVHRAETELTADDESINLRAVRGRACPVCLALWVTSIRDNAEFRDPALVIVFRDGQVQHITCRACETGWWRGDDVALLTDQLRTNTAIYGDAAAWGETVAKGEHTA